MTRKSGYGAFLVLSLLACRNSSNVDWTDRPACHSDTPPPRAVAHDAESAWPNRPKDVPTLSFEQVVRACAAFGPCNVELAGSALSAVSYCIQAVQFSAERAIPMSSFLPSNARAEAFVMCEIVYADDCEAQKTVCQPPRTAQHCQEDGCWGSYYPVSCEGTVAHFETCSGTFDRDCAAAFAECDLDSITGCTDRHYSDCPPDGTNADHCDGNIRLGCDGVGAVSYHDCSRMGGVCKTVDGADDCVYTDMPDPQCEGVNDGVAKCQGSELVVCMRGVRVVVSAPAVCP